MSTPPIAVAPPPVALAAAPKNATAAPTIETLREGNWLAWMTRMTAVFRQNDVLSVVTGEYVEPQDPIAKKAWRDRDCTAKVLITMTIEDDQIVHVFGCETAAQMWDALRIVHEPYGHRSIFSAKRALYCTTAAEGADIPAHLNEMHLLRQRLIRAGEIVTEGEFKVIIASSLPKSWDSYTQDYLGCHGGMQLGGDHPQSLTVEELFSVICEEYEWRKERDEEADVNAAGPRKRPPCATCRRTRRYRGKPKWEICSRFGHTEEECWRNPGNRGKGRMTTRARSWAPSLGRPSVSLYHSCCAGIFRPGPGP